MSTNLNSPQESLNDLKYSWILFKENARAFIYTQLFALISLILVIFLVIIALSVFDIENQPQFELITFIGIVVIVTVFQIFLTSQFGLASDIFLSGHMYAEFRDIFRYFAKSWWRYLIVIILLNLINPVDQIIETQSDLANYELMLFLLLFLFIDFVWYALVIGILPGISHHNHLFRAIRENFQLIRSYPRRIFTSWGLFFVIFTLPVSMFQLLVGPEFDEGAPDPTDGAIALRILILFTILLIEAIRFPMSALIATRIYNNLEEIAPTDEI